MICSKCGSEHPIDELELTFRRPDDAAKLSADDRATLVRENDDLCVIDGKRFFVRALLPLPVEAREAPYSIGLWVEVTQATFERVYELWDSDEQSHEPPFAVRIANEISTPGGSLGLHAELRLTGPTTMPEVLLQPSQHQLYTEQTCGIDEHRAFEYSAVFG